MTRVCMDCKFSIGEKCPRCGTEVTESALFDFVIRAAALIFGVTASDMPVLTCTKCALKFTLGDGGDTHGLCDGCKEKRMTEIYASKEKFESAAASAR